MKCSQFLYLLQELSLLQVRHLNHNQKNSQTLVANRLSRDNLVEVEKRRCIRRPHQWIRKRKDEKALTDL